MGERYDLRAKAGAGLLDEHYPGWAGRIRAESIAMDSCDLCILGQLRGHYFDGYEEIRRRLPDGFLFRASDYGFTLPQCEQNYQPTSSVLYEAVMGRFRALADAWRGEIAARVNKGVDHAERI